jgi:hypothetical protein
MDVSCIFIPLFPEKDVTQKGKDHGLLKELLDFIFYGVG